MDEHREVASSPLRACLRPFPQVTEVLDVTSHGRGRRFDPASAHPGNPYTVGVFTRPEQRLSVPNIQGVRVVSAWEATEGPIRQRASIPNEGDPTDRTEFINA